MKQGLVLNFAILETNDIYGPPVEFQNVYVVLLLTVLRVDFS